MRDLNSLVDRYADEVMNDELRTGVDLDFKEEGPGGGMFRNGCKNGAKG